MNNKEKFENFLESLKGSGQDTLIESVKQGFQACFENDTDPFANYADVIDQLTFDKLLQKLRIIENQARNLFNSSSQPERTRASQKMYKLQTRWEELRYYLDTDEKKWHEAAKRDGMSELYDFGDVIS